MSMIYRYLHLCLLSLLLACAVGANDSYAFAPDKGMLLIANEQLADPRFRDRVILLIQHDTQGTAGLVVNRTSRLPLATILPEGSKLAREGMTLSYGGPVEPQTMLALVTVRNYPPEPADEIIEGLYVTGVGVLDEWPDFADEVVNYRTFVGYTGWAPGQLHAEMNRGDWHVLPADKESIFTGDGVELWERLRETIPKKDQEVVQ
jgi:putative transcriptional regulator